MQCDISEENQEILKRRLLLKRHFVDAEDIEPFVNK